MNFHCLKKSSKYALIKINLHVGQMVNSAWYCAMLKEELKPAICSKAQEC